MTLSASSVIPGDNAFSLPGLSQISQPIGPLVSALTSFDVSCMLCFASLLVVLLVLPARPSRSGPPGGIGTNSVEQPCRRSQTRSGSVVGRRHNDHAPAGQG